MAMVIVTGLGVLLLWLGLTLPEMAVVWRLFLILLGGATLVVADLLRRASALTISLTADRLIDSSGRELCRVADVVAVERSVFAFKPSNGFSVVLMNRQARGWAPGLWWRFGKRVGIGGVTPASQAKFMSEMLAAMLADAKAKPSN